MMTSRELAEEYAASTPLNVNVSGLADLIEENELETLEDVQGFIEEVLRWRLNLPIGPRPDDDGADQSETPDAAPLPEVTPLRTTA